MRNFLIAVVLGITGLTFYSAFAYKSKTIEDDITKRVTDDLAATGAKGVGIDVDGRHVTLSGIVYDEAQEKSYLQVADDTEGALGPIDGLTYQADGGYLTAQKTDTGITLRGSVPNEEARASLLEAAAAATDGEVDDQLVLSGPEADWQGEAGFGLQQLAALSTGALTASAAGYTLSGTTDGDINAVTAPLAEREGWNAFVSSPVVESGLQGQVNDLNGMIAERDGTIDALNATLGEKDGEIAELTAANAEVTGERDDLNTRLEELRAGMSDELVTADSLRTELRTANEALEDNQTKLTGATATIAALTATVATKESEIGTLNGRVEGLETELANALGSSDEQVTALRAEVKKLDAEVYTLDATVAARDTTIENLNNQLVSTSSNLASDNERIAALTAERDDKRAQVTTLLGRVGNLEAAIETESTARADKEAQVETLLGRVSDLEGAVETESTARADKEAQVETLLGRVSDLEGAVETESTARADKEAQVATLLGRVSDLEGALEIESTARADKEAQVATLLGRVGDLEGTVAARDAALGEADTKVAALMDTTAGKDSDINDLNGQIAGLQADVAERDAALTDANAQIASLTSAGEAKDADLGSLTDKVGELTAVVAARDATIASLRANPGSANVAEQCAVQASNVMEGSRINFGSGNARITQESNALLERLTGIALACVGDGLTLEIGGHTDSQGSDAANEALSERRAQAVLAFMSERGVPTSGVRAVGYGEGSPIADNATAEGRAANRRITFEWQAR